MAVQSTFLCCITPIFVHSSLLRNCAGRFPSSFLPTMSIHGHSRALGSATRTRDLHSPQVFHTATTILDQANDDRPFDIHTYIHFPSGVVHKVNIPSSCASALARRQVLNWMPSSHIHTYIIIIIIVRQDHQLPAQFGLHVVVSSSINKWQCSPRSSVASPPFLYIPHY